MCMKRLIRWLLTEKAKTYEGDVTVTDHEEVK